MLKFDLAIPEGALLGNLAKYISKPFEKRTGLTCHLDPIHTVNERWYKLTVSIHKPRSTKDIITFLDIARAWKVIAFLGFCYGEFGLDTYVKNWADMSEESHKIELGYTLAHFLDRKRDFGCLNGHRLHAFKHRSTFADDNIEGIDVDHIADLTRRGYNLRLGNKNCSREVKYHFGDLYYHLYVKTFDAQQERFLDRASWRARRELGVRGEELQKIITPQGFKFENLVSYFSVPKIKQNKRLDDDGMSWSKQGSGKENSEARDALKNLSRAFKADDQQENGSIFFVSKIPNTLSMGVSGIFE